jgi:hypothetical protein
VGEPLHGMLVEFQDVSVHQCQDSLHVLLAAEELLILLQKGYVLSYSVISVEQDIERFCPGTAYLRMVSCCHVDLK